MLWCPRKNGVGFAFTLICFIRGSCHIYVICIICTYIYWCLNRFLWQMIFISFFAVTRRVSLVVQELLPFRYTGVHTWFLVSRVALSLILCVVLYLSLFVFLSFFCCSLYCLSLELRVNITPVLSSNFSCRLSYITLYDSETTSLFFTLIISSL